MSKKNKNHEVALLPVRMASHGLDLYRQSASFQSGYHAGQQVFLERFTNGAWPFIAMLTDIERKIAKFDQCVIDRAGGMKDMLNTLQKQIYAVYSDIEKVLSDLKDSEATEHLKSIVYPRLNAYHRLIGDEDNAADPDAYRDLLTLANSFKSDESLINIALKVNRGGNTPAPYSDFVGSWAYNWLNKHKGVTLSEKGELSNENYRQIAKQLYADLHVRRVEIRDDPSQWEAYELLGECIKLVNGRPEVIAGRGQQAKDVIRNPFRAKLSQLGKTGSTQSK